MRFGTYGAPFPLLVDFKRALSAPPGPSVILFGDSVFQRVAHQDTDRRPLGNLLQEELATRGRSCHALCNTSYTAHMYEVFLWLAHRLGARPQHIMLPFNLRCLSPQWDASPLWQFTQEHAVVEAQIVDPSRPVGALEPVWENFKAYDATAVASPLSQLATVGRFRALVGQKPKDPTAAETRRRELLVFHYGVPARPGHRQLAYIASAVRAAAALGARATVYLTPINMPLIRELGGPRLTDIVAANARLVQDAVRAGNPGRATFRDWLDALPASGFFHENELTEHLCEAGRRRLADLILAEVAAGPAKAESREALAPASALPFALPEGS